MDRHSLKIMLVILIVFTVEIFLTGYLSVLWNVSNWEDVSKHFAYSQDRYIEVAFFHLMPMAVILFIFVHLLPVLKIRENITRDVIVLFVLLGVSQGGWFVLHSPALKVLSSLTLFGVIVYETGLLLKRLYSHRDR